MKLINDFKEFAVKGNMLDMAIGIIIGTAFGKVVSSLVQNIIMPPFGYILGKIDFSNLKLILRKPIIDPAGRIIEDAVSIDYGLFIENGIDFLIIAFTIFIFIKFFNTLKRKAEDEKEPSVPTPKDIQLLSEIRDILKRERF